MKLALLAIAVGHGLSFSLPPGWHVTHRTFTPCIDPVERVSLLRGDAQIMLQERLHPVAAELRRRRPAHFRVHGAPTPLACCSIGSRRGWTIEFGEHGRAFYADIYPGHLPPREVLRVLDSLRVGGRP